MMPENEINNNQTDNGDNVEKSIASSEENAWVKFERGQVSRRAALKKIGITTGMALFAMFSVDDLARMVGQKMEQRAGDSKIAEQIAREFQNSGIALAGSPSEPAGPCGGFDTCNGTCPRGQCCASNFNGCTCGPCVA